MATRMLLLATSYTDVMMPHGIGDSSQALARLVRGTFWKSSCAAGGSSLEASLLEQVASGDQAAVGRVLDQYGDLVWSLARRFLGNSPEAEDAVQEIFIEVWTHAERYNPDLAGEVTFIATIARRRLIDRLRKNGRKPPSEEYDEGIARQNPETTDLASENVEVHNVVRILDAMPEEHRTVLALSIYEGYSHSEIAEQLDMPLGTVKTRVRRGLLHIREQLNLDADGTEGASQ